MEAAHHCRLEVGTVFKRRFYFLVDQQGRVVESGFTEPEPGGDRNGTDRSQDLDHSDLDHSVGGYGGSDFGRSDCGRSDCGRSDCGRSEYDPCGDCGTLLQAVKDYFGGRDSLGRLATRLPKASGFRKRVWRCIASIPFGCTISYQRLAEKCGSPKGVRAVATACGTNKVPLFIPCHRVIKSNGATGHYAFGARLKAQLIAHELRFK
ncbi:methylated-DNA-protein cysteine methyltransferase [Gregarina niphandrodes]|uniref:Methylated-DNA--protein-cysteine methyltransferase n=1 Tax=Gregarina niphandrodes TaxID=110365 RepID=A0A023B546_GRENI|nr:methylated-DNA-protein cysteine methyltransferase [Gregarina niphandrodes]EZG58469.1 methylated-DNA-protein cysteine methyltransferase [Gregarina niphandrodes]|eukprot:XP_011130968.1 methylated-DNA-protein cysteine methyltransferase [Gregarina niphandrodes]